MWTTPSEVFILIFRDFTYTNFAIIVRCTFTYVILQTQEKCHGKSY